MSGWVKIYRRILDNPAFRNEAEAMCFAWMVLRAQWRDTEVRYKGRVIRLRRGELAISLRDMADDWEWSKSRCERFIDRLKTGTLTETRTETGVTIITICNYSKYQDPEDEAGTVAETEAGQDRDTTGTQNKKGRIEETKKGGKRATALPPQFPGDDDRAKALAYWNQEGVAHVLDLDDQVQRFRDHHDAKGSTFKSWPAAWRTWFRNAVDFKRRDLEARGEALQFKRQGPQLTDEEWRQELLRFKNTGLWRPSAGEKRPGQPGCLAPDHLLEEFGYIEGDLFKGAKA